MLLPLLNLLCFDVRRLFLVVAAAVSVVLPLSAAAWAQPRVTVSGSGFDATLIDTLDASINLPVDAVIDPRSSADFNRLRIERDRLASVMRGFGYYAAAVDVMVGAAPLSIGDGAIANAPLTSGPASFAIEAGPLYRIRSFEVTAENDAESPRFDGMTGLSGAPATAETLAAAESSWRQLMHDEGFAFAEATSREVRPDDATRTVDVAMTVEPGPLVEFGEVSFRGQHSVPTAKLQELVQFKAGDRYLPAKIDALRAAIEALPLIESARVQLASAPIEGSVYPVTVTVTERTVARPATHQDGLIGMGVLAAAAMSVAAVQLVRARSGDSSPWHSHWSFYLVALLLGASAAMAGLRVVQFLS